MNYYTSIIALSIMTLAVLCILVHENGRINNTDKKLFYTTYLIIALSALAEWTGLKLNGVQDIPKWPLLAAKCADYILTPMSGCAIIAQVSRSKRWRKPLIVLIAANTVFQVIACICGWMIQIDELNRYSHGPLYVVYVVVYLLVLAALLVEFALYGRKFRRQNRVSLYAIITLIVAGIAAQEFLGSEYRTSYIALAIGAALLFIHYSEFDQLAKDDKLHEQDILIATDALTGLLNRYAYARTLESYDESEKLPADLCAFAFDINGLKRANDTMGHAVGDELICGAAECIKRVFGKNGKCFRTGGDEFIVFAKLGREKAKEAQKRIHAEAAGWSGKKISKLDLACGYALAKDHPGISAEKLVIEADQAMYTEKKVYYSESGNDRRAR